MSSWRRQGKLTFNFFRYRPEKILSHQRRDRSLNAVWSQFVLTTVRNAEAYSVCKIASGHVTPQPIYAYGKKCPIILWIGGWVGPTAGPHCLEGRKKSCPFWDSKPGPSSPNIQLFNLETRFQTEIWCSHSGVLGRFEFPRILRLV